MKKYFLHHQVIPLLMVMLFFTNCNAQVKNQPQATINKTQAGPSAQPKLVKTQGTDQYANIFCALMDRNGNLWFGTTGEGVYRYDGKQFTQFTVKDGLSNNKVRCILEDNAGNIWLGTAEGLCRYNGKIITRIHIPVSSSYYPNRLGDDDTIGKEEVWSIMQDKSGKLWFGTKNSLYCYNGTSFTRFLETGNIVNNNTLQLKMVDCMLQDKNGNVWFGSGMPPGLEGLCRYDGKSITQFKPGGAEWIRTILEDKNENIWLGTRYSGVWRYDGKAFSKFTGEEGIGNPVLIDKAGNIWFGGGENESGFRGDRGIWRYNGKTFTNFTSKDGFGDYSVWCMVEDRDGNIWIGTRNMGLYRYNGKTFTCFSD